MNPEKFQLPKKYRLFVSIGTLATVLITFNQCVIDNKKTNTKAKFSTNSTVIPAPAVGDAGDIDSDQDLPDGLVMPPMNSPSEDTESELIDVGVKDFEQINATMSAVTGVPTTDGAIQTVYRTVVTQLPSDNSIKSFLPAHQVAITKLAAEYCERLVENGTLRAAIWPGINFDGNPPAVFTAANKAAIINRTIDRFIGPLESQERVLTFNELTSLFDTLLAGENLTINTTTKKVVKGVCISSLASAHVTLL